MGLIILLVSGTMLMGAEIRLADPLGRMKLPVKVVMKMLGILSLLVEWIAKVSSPRLLVLTGPGARPAVALMGIILGIAMLAPIPFTNMVPSIGLAIICVGLLNHDGLLILAGTIVGVIGLALLVVAVWIIVVLGFAIENAVDGEAELVSPPATAGNGQG